MTRLLLHNRLHSEYDSRFDVLVSVVWGGFPSFSHFSCTDARGYSFTYCFGHPWDILLRLPGLSMRQFLMLSIVFSSVLIQSFCHDSSWVSEIMWTHMVIMCSQWLEIIFVPEWYQCPQVLLTWHHDSSFHWLAEPHATCSCFTVYSTSPRNWPWSYGL